jgi:hypothetical protein
MAPGGGSSTPITGALIGADGNNNYQAFADVTTLVRGAGAGNYTVANVQAATGTGRQGGWGLVVAYRDPLADPRNLTVFDGLALVNNASPNVSFPINGFQAPPNGTVNANIGVLTYEGDAGLTGDGMALDGTVLTDALNPATNFFNSTISRNGTRVGTKNPDYINQLGFDADFVAANGVILNNANSATIALTTGGETYLPGVVTTSIDLYAPILRIPKIVNNLTHPSGPTRPCASRSTSTRSPCARRATPGTSPCPSATAGCSWTGWTWSAPRSRAARPSRPSPSASGPRSPGFATSPGAPATGWTPPPLPDWRDPE